MHRRQIHERSPLRVFERSIHGGLGAGNIGVVASRAGTGKTSFLVGIALDDLMRRRKVCHVALEQSVDHVREYYDELFNDLRHETHTLGSPEDRIEMERARHIHSFVGHCFSVEKLSEMLASLREDLRFEPSLLVVDGHDFRPEQRGEVEAMREIARRAGCELWMSVRTHRDGPVTKPGELPTPLGPYAEILSVVVGLESVGDTVRIRLLKDHDSPALADLYLDLDPRTMLIVER
jgi:hypothetical protein